VACRASTFLSSSALVTNSEEEEESMELGGAGEVMVKVASETGWSGWWQVLSMGVALVGSREIGRGILEVGLDCLTSNAVEGD
jgi:hypothetical protein